MKKILGLSMILLSGLLLSGCGVKPINDTATTFSLRDLIAKNIPQKCTWSSIQEESESTGTMIISGNKFKQEITVKEDDTDLVVNSISDGTYIYTWQEKDGKVSPDMAIKMKLDTFENPDKDTASNDNPTLAGTVDLDQQYQYNCSPTIVSESDFQPPKDVKFADYSQFMKDIQSQLPSINPADFE